MVTCRGECLTNHVQTHSSLTLTQSTPQMTSFKSFRQYKFLRESLKISNVEGRWSSWGKNNLPKKDTAPSKIKTKEVSLRLLMALKAYKFRRTVVELPKSNILKRKKNAKRCSMRKLDDSRSSSFKKSELKSWRTILKSSDRMNSACRTRSARCKSRSKSERSRTRRSSRSKSRRKRGREQSSSLRWNEARSRMPMRRLHSRQLQAARLRLRVESSLS